MVSCLFFDTARHNLPYIALHFFSFNIQLHPIIFHAIHRYIIRKIKNVFDSHCKWVDAFYVFDGFLHFECFEPLRKHFFQHFSLNVVRFLLFFLFLIILLFMKLFKLLDIFLSHYLVAICFLFIAFL